MREFFASMFRVPSAYDAMTMLLFIAVLVVDRAAYSRMLGSRHRTLPHMQASYVLSLTFHALPVVLFLQVINKILAHPHDLWANLFHVLAQAICWGIFVYKGFFHRPCKECGGLGQWVKSKLAHPLRALAGSRS